MADVLCPDRWCQRCYKMVPTDWCVSIPWLSLRCLLCGLLIERRTLGGVRDAAA